MHREEAEKLLAAFVFGDLDEGSRAEMAAYLQTDDELRERAADMRMAAKVASDALLEGPEPVLDARRLKHLAKLAAQRKRRPVITVRRSALAAGIVLLVGLPLCFLCLSTFSGRAVPNGAFSLVLHDRTVTEEAAESLEKRDSREQELIRRLREARPNAESESGRRSRGPQPLMQMRVAPADEAAAGAKYDIEFSGGTSVALTPPPPAPPLAKPSVVAAKPAAPRTPVSSRSAEGPAVAVMPAAKAPAPPSTDGLRTAGGIYSNGGERFAISADAGVAGGFEGAAVRGGRPAIANGAAADDGRVALGREYAARPEPTLSPPTSQPEVPGTDRTAGTFDYRGMAADSIVSREEQPAVNIQLYDRSPLGQALNQVPMGEVGANELKTDAYYNKLGYEGSALGAAGRRIVLKNATVQSGAAAAAASTPRDAAAAEMAPVDKKMDAAERVGPGFKLPMELSRETTEEWNSVSATAVSEAAGVGGGGMGGAAATTWEAENSDEFTALFVDGGVANRRTEGEEAGKALTRTHESRLKADADSFEVKAEVDYARNWGLLKQKYESEAATVAAEAVNGPVGKDMARVEEQKRRMLEDVKLNAVVSDKEAVRADVSGRVRGAVEEDELVAVKRVSETARPDGSDLPPASRFRAMPVNPWVMTEQDRLSTFGLDVDTASYALCRRYIRGGFLPPAGAVRIEEFVNYFDYRYPQRSEPTFAVHAEGAPSPFAGEGQDLALLKIAVKARTIGRDQQKAAHLVFVVDTSASMGQADRMPLVQQALDMLVRRLSPADRVTLVTCADEARLVLESAPAGERGRIRQAVWAMQPSGTTNLLLGLQLGYAAARRAYVPGRVNHVVLCSDGVANVGETQAEAVLKAVAADRKQGITLTCVGVGYGGYNDAFLETLANQGDGSYVFLDSAEQAQRVFVEQLAATLHTVAKDARIQVEFDPARVRRYRLIGYENRDIADVRFRDDTVDAGEVGSGQCSTALYEVELTRAAAESQDLGTVFVRYRNTDTGQIEEISKRLDSDVVRKLTVAESPCFYLAAAAARFAELLRGSEHARNGSLEEVYRIVDQVSAALPLDRDVRELAALIKAAENLPKAP
ncbi:MAG TPA: von Willebrand factor type A domain-containing protein [Anaerohalosphaeraceae bacterium]|jgi:Ca-activated chloride channel family protein|nr:von Willebrand factor type A domain-containing protein [Anaerohalosphaeraceae bacterium]HRT49692.1 von Willebrand factor type A domain-containing protein [Anaerohalosphaeraceae bacterium]HRT86009.1 von Willebrand factor type A domain-containing protein [Anaerohalosphaeraceae bacterium]